MRFRIYSKETPKEYIKEFKTEADAIQWVENHLDLSSNWQVVKMKG